MSTGGVAEREGALSIVGPWQLLPEGGVLHPGERTAVIADVHLGYEWARGASGDSIPAHSLAETVTKLDSLLARGPVERLVVAGDLVESARPCLHTAEEVTRLIRWLLERGVRLVLLRGNHDQCVGAMAGPGFGPNERALLLPSQLDVAGWSIAHGHLPTSARRLIMGHHHPVLRVGGRPAPCFLAGECRIILPAFSNNAAGLDLASGRSPRSWRRHSLRTLVSTGTEVLDFGPLETLSARLAAAAPRPMEWPRQSSPLDMPSLDRPREGA
jgi:putative SbcD/Mre11-related phosphoesterase